MLSELWRRALATALGVGAAAGVASAQYPPGQARVVYSTPSGVPGVYLVGGQTAPAEQPPVMAAPVATECATNTCATGCAPGEKPSCRNSGCWGGPYGLRDCAKKPATLVPPHGYSARFAYDTMRLNALAEYFVVYREDWEKDSAELTASGERHVAGIAKRMGLTACAAKVEPSGKPELDARRLSALSAALMQAGAADGASRVVMGGTRAEGLLGNEIESVFQRSPYSLGGGGTQNTGGYGGGNGGGYGGYR